MQIKVGEYFRFIRGEQPLMVMAWYVFASGNLVWSFGLNVFLICWRFLIWDFNFFTGCQIEDRYWCLSSKCTLAHSGYQRSGNPCASCLPFSYNCWISGFDILQAKLHCDLDPHTSCSSISDNSWILCFYIHHTCNARLYYPAPSDMQISSPGLSIREERTIPLSERVQWYCRLALQVVQPNFLLPFGSLSSKLLYMLINYIAVYITFLNHTIQNPMSSYTALTLH